MKSKRRIPYVDVREVREGMGLTQQEFARKYGFSITSIRKWEEGVSKPYPNAAILIALLALHPEVVNDVLERCP